MNETISTKIVDNFVDNSQRIHRTPAAELASSQLPVIRAVFPQLRPTLSAMLVRRPALTSAIGCRTLLARVG
jgi:hypothetical protein